MALSKEKEKLFKKVRTRLGSRIRSTELSDDDLCDLLEMAVEDYAEKVQNFIIESNWAQLYGKSVVGGITNQDIAYSLSLRSLDLMKDYSQWFSKQVGLQTQGRWELKKDFFKIEEGRQVYLIPSGREINKVFWVTPPTTDSALWANYGGFGVSFGGGVTGQMGIGAASIFGGMNSAYGLGAGIWALPAYDMSLMAADLSYKQQFIRSDLVYKVTAGPDGSHLVHLMSTPGSKLTFGAGGMKGLYSLKDCYVWYTYYDTSLGNADECRRDNPDVILSPDQVPLDEMDYELLNAPTKAIVRQILVGMAAEHVAFVRGKFSGSINMISSPLQMDYNMLLTFGKSERDAAMADLKERLSRMSPYETMKKNADMTDDMLRIQKKVPLGIYVH